MRIFIVLAALLISNDICSQSSFEELLQLFPKAELPYSPPEEYPDFDPDYPDDLPQAFSGSKLPDAMVKQFLDPYADEGATKEYPVHQLNLGQYIGLIVYSYQFNRMDGTFMPFYYLYMFDASGKQVWGAQELSTQYSRMSMSDIDIFESMKVMSVIRISEYDESKFVLENTSIFTQSKSGEFGQRKREETIGFYVMNAEGKWNNVTDRF